MPNQLGATLDPISGAIGAVSAVAGTIGQIVDASKRRQIEANFNLLDASQKAQLERELQRTNDRSKRLEILYNSVASIRAAQSSSAIQLKAQRERTLAFVVVGGAIVILIGIVLLKRK
jgi:hypothetical protein